MRQTVKTMMLLVTTTLLSAGLYAQQHPERHHIRSGNRAYEELEFEKAEQAYRKATVKTPGVAESGFNLADALYKQGRYEEAENTLKTLTSKENSLLPAQAAQAYYNLGNAQFAQQKLSEALESYKQSLRLNPDDKEAKYNYVYTKKLLDKNQNNNQNNNQNQNNQDNNDQNQNQNQNNQNNPDQNNQNGDGNDNQNNQDNSQNPNDNNGQDNNNNNNDQNGQGEDNPTPPSKGGQSPQKSGISQQEAEQILNAIQGQEDKTREKVDAQKAVAVGRSGKNW